MVRELFSRKGTAMRFIRSGIPSGVLKSALLAASVLAISGVAPAFAAEGDDSPTTAAPKPDNTATNKQDQDVPAPTADQASNSKEDLKLAAKIRRSLMKDKK